MKNVILLLMIVSLAGNAQVNQLAKSVNITYQVPDTLQAQQWYVEVRVNQASDGFYGATFSEGSIGLTWRNKQKELLFQIKNPASVALVGKGVQVKAGTLGAVTWRYNWQPGLAYKLLVSALIDSASKTTFYSGYVFLPKEQQWKFLASYKLNPKVSYISSPSVAIADYQPLGSAGKQKLTVTNTWLQRRNGTWKELAEAKFSSNNNNGGMGIENGRLFISGKSLVVPVAEEGKTVKVAAGNQRPVADYTNHVDSLAQVTLDKQQIFYAVASGKMDTTGTVQQVYYTTLQEGNGAFVEVTDTVTVHYKGSLLKDGSVFDQTKDKPATFPLNRLIKGWQYGLTKCKVGGKIRLTIPSGLAYSIRQRSKDIPPNSVLVFDIEVLAVKKPG